MESLAVVLRRVPLFSDLPPGGFAKIIADLREEVFEPGAVVCTEGDIATDFFVIRSGEVLVYVDRATGERELVDTMGANHWFGESALFSERRRTAPQGRWCGTPSMWKNGGWKRYVMRQSGLGRATRRC